MKKSTNTNQSNLRLDGKGVFTPYTVKSSNSTKSTRTNGGSKKKK